MPQIFMSYSSEDSIFADLVILKLKAVNIDVWIDHRALSVGEEWRNSIDQGIASSDVLIVVLTPESCKSPYVTYEWAFALGAGIKVIPLLLKNSEIHPRLEALQYLDFREQRRGPWNTLFEEIAKSQDRSAPPESSDSNAINRLEQRLDQQSKLIRELVHVLRTKTLTPSTYPPKDLLSASLSLLEGAWLFENSGGYAYARIVNGELFVPYCYDGDYELTAVYYDWTKIGDLWFCRFKWFEHPVNGFAFYKQVSNDILEGSWWQNEGSDPMRPAEELIAEVEPLSDGVRTIWQRSESRQFPKWATEYLANLKNYKTAE